MQGSRPSWTPCKHQNLIALAGHSASPRVAFLLNWLFSGASKMSSICGLICAIAGPALTPRVVLNAWIAERSEVRALRLA